MRRRTLLAALVPAALAGQQKRPSDDEIFDQVRRRLANDATVKGGALEVDVKDGVVTIRGTVDAEKQKERAERVARKVQGVKKVNNLLQVGRGNR